MILNNDVRNHIRGKLDNIDLQSLFSLTTNENLHLIWINIKDRTDVHLWPLIKKEIGNELRTL